MPIKKTTIDWYKYKDRCDVLREFGWCLVILKLNFKECDDEGLDYNNQVASYGFEKAWFNNGDFWVVNPHGRGTEKVTDRVALVAKLPRENIKKLLVKKQTIC